MPHRFLLPLLLILILIPTVTGAQGELAATLEVLSRGVEVQRVNTVNWIEVNVEAIVGVGDSIRTNATGRARITYFADGVDTEIQPNTEYRIERFEGDEESFNIEANVLVGQTVQRLNRLLDADSSYEIHTPAMALVARGTQFTIRVESSGRSAMLVADGTVGASKGDDTASVAPGFGIRADESLSDVVRAATFEALDASLDGCSAALTTPDDVSLNVRLGPNRDFARIGTVQAADIDRLYGATESGDWYRISFRGGYGWILSSTARLDENCVGLRRFADDTGPEDAAKYESVGDPVNLEDLLTPTSDATPEATAEA